jgi:hypothetical protein
MAHFVERVGRLVGRIPVLGNLAGAVYTRLFNRRFAGSEQYWLQRYAAGDNSGAGSYGRLQQFKADALNQFVGEQQIRSVIEYGCGDGSQLKLAHYPRYLGFDVSPNALDRCRSLFAGDSSKTFKLISEYSGESAELTLSLDVIYHLIEDAVFADYMQRLFTSAERFVVIYSSNSDQQNKLQAAHVRHRKFSDWIDRNRSDWQLLRRIPNDFATDSAFGEGLAAEFFVYRKQPAGTTRQDRTP